MEKEKLIYKSEYTGDNEVELDIQTYHNNGRIFIGLITNEDGYPEPFGDVTVNIDAPAPDYCGYLDTNNLSNVENGQATINWTDFLRSYTIKTTNKGAINMTEQKQRRKPRKYTDEFKKQLVDLYRSGKRRCDICREYDIATSLFDKWVKQAENSGSFHEKDNRTPEQEELLRLRKENQQLKMENDILKQAALILGRK